MQVWFKNRRAKCRQQAKQQQRFWKDHHDNVDDDEDGNDNDYDDDDGNDNEYDDDDTDICDDIDCVLRILPSFTRYEMIAISY